MLELTHARLIPAPPERAYAALHDLDQRVRWWGPDGFTSTSEADDFRPGGRWTMTLHGPDGTAYPNVYDYVAIEAPTRVVMIHPDAAHWFELTVTFAAEADGTRVGWHQRFVDEAHFAEIKDFVAAANEQVLARMEAVALGLPVAGLGSGVQG